MMSPILLSFLMGLLLGSITTFIAVRLFLSYKRPRQSAELRPLVILAGSYAEAHQWAARKNIPRAVWLYALCEATLKGMRDFDLWCVGNYLGRYDAQRIKEATRERGGIVYFDHEVPQSVPDPRVSVAESFRQELEERGYQLYPDTEEAEEPEQKDQRDDQKNDLRNRSRKRELTQHDLDDVEDYDQDDQRDEDVDQGSDHGSTSGS